MKTIVNKEINGNSVTYTEEHTGYMPEYYKSEVINMTPHRVNIVKDGEVVLTLDKAEEPLRLSTKTVDQADGVGDFRFSKTVFGDCKELPKEKDGVYYIVSRIFLEAFPERRDLIVPNEVVRDDDGNIVGCKSFDRK